MSFNPKQVDESSHYTGVRRFGHILESQKPMKSDNDFHNPQSSKEKTGKIPTSSINLWAFEGDGWAGQF